MKTAAIVNVGLEKISAKEVLELVDAKTSLEKGFVFFDLKNLTDLARFAYFTQSANRVVAVLFKTTFTTQEDLFSKLEKGLKDLSFASFGFDKPSFVSKAKRLGTHDFSSVDIQDSVTKIIAGQEFSVDVHNPNIFLFTQVVDNRCVVGVDVSGFDLSKREYKIFSHAASLKGPVGYGVVRMSGFSSGKKIVVIPCHDGVLPIEAASFAFVFSLNYFRKDKFAFNKWKNVEFDADDKKENSSTVYAFDDNLQHLTAAKKNAKIAELNNEISFSKIAVEWLDTKFDKSSIDCVIGSLIRPEKKIVQDLFYQSKFVLKPQGTLTIVSRKEPDFLNYLEEYGFSTKEKIVLEKGESKLYVYVFVKK